MKKSGETKLFLSFLLFVYMSPKQVVLLVGCPSVLSYISIITNIFLFLHFKVIQIEVGGFHTLLFFSNISFFVLLSFSLFCNECQNGLISLPSRSDESTKWFFCLFYYWWNISLKMFEIELLSPTIGPSIHPLIHQCPIITFCLWIIVEIVKPINK